MSRVAAVVAVLVLCAGVAGCSDEQATRSVAEQVPALSSVLHRVDEALATHRFEAARHELQALRTDVKKARDAGEITAAEARRVLTAVTRLLALLPEPSGRATESGGPSSPNDSTGTSGPRPSATKSAHDQESATPTPSVVATPSTSSPSATPSSTPDVSPDASPDASPAASPGGDPTGRAGP